MSIINYEIILISYHFAYLYVIIEYLDIYFIIKWLVTALT